MNKGLLLVLIGILVLIIVAMSIFFITTLGILGNSEPSDTFKTMSFDGITASVPSNSNFISSLGSHIDYDHGIYIFTWGSEIEDKNDVNKSLEAYINDNKLTEIHMDGVPPNIKTYVSESGLEVILTNDKKDQAITIGASDPKLTIKIAKTVKFK